MKEMILGDRMKFYENFNKQFLAPNQYVLMRLDGKSFSNFTKKYFNKPFDNNFINIMQEVAKYLFSNISGCCAAYVQSDEITLLLTDMKSKGMEGWFNYRVDKMCSIAASMATAKFNNLLYALIFENLYTKCDMLPTFNTYEISDELNQMPLPVFDCRVWNVPNSDEAKNVFLWRQRDCIRNSVLQYAQSFFTHKELMNKNIDAVKELIRNKFPNDDNEWWENLDNVVKYGTFFFKEFDTTINRHVIIKFNNLMENNENISCEFKHIFDDVVKY